MDNEDPCIVILEELPLLSRGYFFVLGERDHGLIQGDKVELKLGDDPWIPAVVVGLKGVLDIVFSVDLALDGKYDSAIEKFSEAPERHEFRFVERCEHDIDLSRPVSAEQITEVLNSF